MTAAPQLDSIADIIQDIRAGRMVVVTDDEDRENEDDLVMAAEKITAEAVNFMAMHGRELICARSPMSARSSSACSVWCWKTGRVTGRISRCRWMRRRA